MMKIEEDSCDGSLVSMFASVCCMSILNVQHLTTRTALL